MKVKVSDILWDSVYDDGTTNSDIKLPKEEIVTDIYLSIDESNGNFMSRAKSYLENKYGFPINKCSVQVLEKPIQITVKCIKTYTLEKTITVDPSMPDYMIEGSMMSELTDRIHYDENYDDSLLKESYTFEIKR